MTHHHKKAEKAAMQIDYRLDIQGLRAIAVILVILAHFGATFLPGGHIGVDVFFVISGFLITGLLIRERQNTGKINLFEFYSRRMKRLAPAMLLVIASTLIATALLLSEYTLLQQGASAPYAFTWTSNLYFGFTEADYFDELHNQDLFIHTWSLAVEEQFYLLWPLLLLSLMGPQSSTKKLFFGLTGLALISYIACYFLSHHAPALAFYMMPARAWQFAIGGLVYIGLTHPTVKKSLTRLPDHIKLLAAITGIGLVIVPAFFITSSTVYPGTAALLPTIGAAITIAIGGSGGNLVSATLSSKMAIWFGNRSYSLYLWHWPVWVIGGQLMPQGSTIYSLLLGAVTMALSAASYRYLELPFWKGSWSHIQRHSLMLWSWVLVVIIFAIGASKYHQHLSAEGESLALQHATSAQMDIPVIYNSGCDTWYHSAEVMPCVLGTPKKGHIVLIGDSIGLQWFSMAPEIFPPSEWRISVFTKSNCPAVDEEIFYERINSVFEICSQWRKAAIEQINNINADIVFIGSSAFYDFSPEQWIDGTKRIVENLSAERILLIAPTSRLGFNGPTCTANQISLKGPDGLAAAHAICAAPINPQTIEVTNHLKSAANQFEHIEVVNLNHIVCPENRCSAVTQGGVSAYRDGQHISNSFVVSHIEQIATSIFKAIQDTSAKKLN